MRQNFSKSETLFTILVIESNDFESRISRFFSSVTSFQFNSIDSMLAINEDIFQTSNIYYNILITTELAVNGIHGAPGVLIDILTIKMFY